jgi:hypothetical protein
MTERSFIPMQKVDSSQNLRERRTLRLARLGDRRMSRCDGVLAETGVMEVALRTSDRIGMDVVSI